MRYNFFLVLIIFTPLVWGQQVLLKTYETKSNEIELNAFGLDEIKIINSLSDKIEINLYDENPNSHSISLNEEYGVLKISFELPFIEESAVFRKFITERIHRARAVIKLPEKKTITINGDNIDVISKGYKGDLNIYIDKGTIQLNKIQENVVLKLYQGNVLGILNNVSIDVRSRKGTIKVNDSIYKISYRKELENGSKLFKMESIKGNVTLFDKFK